MTNGKVEEITEEKVTDEETPEQAKIEIDASISSDGTFQFNATEGTHPMFLIGLLQMCINNLTDSLKVDTND